MILSARCLSDVGSVNSFDYVQNAEFSEGDAVDIYFQLVDSAKATPGEPQGRRYVPAASATLSVVIDNIDAAKQVTRACSQPYSGDLSIWRLSILSTDVLKGTANLKLTLVEGAVTRRGLVKAFFRIHPVDTSCT